MIKIENVSIHGIKEAIRGMRNPLNSWDKSDSYSTYVVDPDTLQEAEFEYFVGDNDISLMQQLAAGGPVHAKYRRMIDVYLDITAPLYWWKEFDTYKVGTVANSCSTMHTIHKKEFTREDFSDEHLITFKDIPDANNILVQNINSDYTSETVIRDDAPVIMVGTDCMISPNFALSVTINMLNRCRELYLKTRDKRYWWQMIQLLPSSYNQRRTIKLNYEVLTDIYRWRKDHKLDEWREFCQWIETLPHSEVITWEGEKNEK
jgi:hypothetical protein